MQLFKKGLLIACCFLLLACSINVKKDNLLISNDNLNKNKPGIAVFVGNVTGNFEAKTLLKFQVSSETFFQALVENLQRQGLYHSQSGYQLDAELLGMETAINDDFFKTRTQTAKVRYRVSDRKTGDVVVDKVVAASHRGTAYTTPMTEIEHASVKNMQAFMSELSAVDTGHMVAQKTELIEVQAETPEPDNSAGLLSGTLTVILGLIMVLFTLAA